MGRGATDVVEVDRANMGRDDAGIAPPWPARRLPIRVCSGRKTNVARGTLAEIYDAPMLRAFFLRFDTYCVLSRKLGICHSGVVYENYGDHEEKDKGSLARLLASQASAYEDILFVYWNHRPLTHDPFVRLLREAGFHVAEERSLDDVWAILDTPAQHSMD